MHAIAYIGIMPDQMRSYLDFEKPVAELEAKVEDLRALSEREDSPPIGEELAKLQAKAAKALADCWHNHLGPAPKKAWYDGHQQMEQGLVRFGRFVNEIEKKPGAKAGPGDRYIALAKFLLDCRKGGTEYDQSHLPVVQQYEAVGHAVRAVYTYSGMADVAVETHDSVVPAGESVEKSVSITSCKWTWRSTE